MKNLKWVLIVAILVIVSAFSISKVVGRSGEDITLLGGVIVTEDVNVTGNITQKSIVYFDELSDLPTPVGTEIRLVANIHYIYTGQVPLYMCDTPTNPATCTTHYSIVFPSTGADSGLIGINITNAPLVYVGAGSFLIAENFSSIRVENIALAAPYGQLFDLDGLGAFTDPSSLVKINDVVIEDVANLGIIKDTTLGINFSQLADYGQGLISDSNRLSIERLPFFAPKNVTKNTSATFDNVGNTVDATAHNMFDNDVVRLTSTGTLPTGLRESITDLNGAVIDNSDGTVRFTTTADHDLLVGDIIFPRGTTSYDSYYTVLVVPTTKTFDVEETFTAETFSNNVVQIGYYIVNKTDNDFQLSRTEGGTVVTFTDNGTGTHEFFENSIGLTLRGTTRTMDMEVVSSSVINPDNTLFDFEPTITGSFSRGGARATGFPSQRYLNNFTNSSLNQKYKHYRFTGNLNHPDSKNSGVVYSSGNSTATPMTQGDIAEVTQGTFAIDSSERSYLSSNRLCNDNPSVTTETFSAVVTLLGTTATAKKTRLHILLNGEDATIAEPATDVANRSVSLVDIEEITWKEGDCISLGLENETNDEDITAEETKLLRLAS